MADSLYRLSLKVVAGLMQEGTLRDEPTKLPSKMSNDFYQAFSCEFFYDYLPPGFSDVVAQWLEPTSISIRTQEFGKLDMMKSMKKLVKLKTSCLSLSWTLRSRRTNPDGAKEVKLGYVDALGKILSPESRKSLKALELSGEYLSSIPEWPSRLSKLLPSLESMSISHEEIDESTFQQLCESFTNLKFLGLTHSSIASIKGISRLQNLQSLSLRDVEFQTAEALEEIFELRNLRVLDVHFNYVKSCLTMKRYLECGKVLPNLVALDCSSNEFSVEQLEQLLTTHPNLRVVNIVDTNVANVKRTHPEIVERFPAVKLFTSESLRSCIEYFNECNPCHRTGQVRRVFDEAIAMLGRNARVFSDEDLRDWFHTMLKVMGRPEYDDGIVYMAVQCMLPTCRLPRFGALFTFAEKQSLIRALFIATRAEFMEEYISQIFNIDAILDNSVDNLHEICYWANKMLGNSRSGPIATENSLEILTKVVWRMTPERRKVAEEGFRETATKKLDSMNFHQIVVAYLRVIRSFASEEKESDREVIDFLMEFCEKAVIAKVAALNMMRNMVTNLDEDIRKSFFNERYLAILNNCFEGYGFGAPGAAVSLLVELYSCSVPLDSKQRLIEAVHKFIIGYQEGFVGLKVFEAIVREKQNEESVKFANWILGHFLEKPEAMSSNYCCIS